MLIKGSNQTLIIETGKDLAGVTSPKIRYRKPDGSLGSFEADVVGSTLRKKFETNELDQTGGWTFQPEITSSGDLLLGKNKVSVTVEEPIPTAPA